MVVVPVALPLTTPAAVTLAIDGLLLLQVPPVPVVVNVLVVPTHIIGVPLIVPADGDRLTVITFVAIALPQLLLTA